MRAPSAKRLVKSFRDLTRDQANQIRALAHACGNPERLATLVEEKHPATRDYVRSLFSSPYRSQIWRVTVAMHAIDRVLGTYGVEGLGPPRSGDYAPPYEYCNAGDTYSTTLIYKRATDTLLIGSWGDIVEKEDPRGEW